MVSATHIRFLTQKDQTEALKLMCSAFEHDDVVPSLIATENDLKQKQNGITMSCQNLLEKAFSNNDQLWGMFNESDTLVSLAIVEKSTVSRFNIQCVFSNMMLLLKMVFSFSGKTINRFLSFNKKLDDIKKMYDGQNLVVFAVRPDMQGKGYGKAFLQRVITYNQQLNQYKGMMLYTQNKTNVEIYKKIGFVLTKEVLVENIHMYFMYTHY